MIAELEKWKEGWQGISLGLRNDEIDHLIMLLQEIRSDNDQHFHISSDCKGEPGLGGIEIYVKTDKKKTICILLHWQRLQVRKYRNAL